MSDFQDKAKLIWDIAELLRGDYKQADYGKVILPMTVLRRLDCVLEPTRKAVLKTAEKMTGGPLKDLEPLLNRVTGLPFHNTSRLNFEALKGDAENVAANLSSYIQKFSPRAREVLERFQFDQHIARMDAGNILYLVVRRFAEMDLRPEAVSNHEMGSIFEELIRRFSEQSNETAGEHFTPREVIRLMVNILFSEDSETLTRKGIIRTLYDPACGTGGMLSVAEEYLWELNPDARLEVFGQELNPEAFAICNSDMMIKGQNPDNIQFGNSFSQDGFRGKRFDYMLSNPPFGVDWKKVETEIRKEHEKSGYAGRFGAGLPRINDGSLLFLQHMLSKMKAPDQGGSRLAIVFNGSPLFTGDAGSGESNIRRWIIENDWLEAIIALPDQLFYNTGISTYIWVLSNRKSHARRGKIQLVNATSFFQKMRKSLGDKRNEIAPEQIAEITRIYGEFAEGEFCKLFDNDDFGYHRITVERPLRLSFQASPERLQRLTASAAWEKLAVSKKKGQAGIEETEAGQRYRKDLLRVLGEMDAATLYKSRPAFEKALADACRRHKLALSPAAKKAILDGLGERDERAEICRDAKGKPEPDPELRDYENVPLKEDIACYFEREVLPHVPDAWIDESKTRIGYEIPFTRHFYRYQPLRPLEEIDREIRELEADIQASLQEVLK